MVVTLSSSALAAEISPVGAELVRLRDRDGHDLLWNGDPADGTGRSPFLFPIVGCLRDDRATIAGPSYGLPQHGFAHPLPFELVTVGPSFCQFRLMASAATTSQSPFAFALEVSYGLEGSTLLVQAAVTNAGPSVMPVSFGFRPVLRWPLPYGGAREAHEIRFETPEPAPIRRPRDGLIAAPPHPTPVDGQRLLLRDALFADGALIFNQLHSRIVHYGVPGRRALRVAFPDLRHLGLWTRPSAGFVGIAPWQGYADPEDCAGGFAETPGLVQLAPGAVRTFEMALSVTSGSGW